MLEVISKGLTPEATDGDIGAFIDLVRSRKLDPSALLPLLSERHPVYRQRSTARVGKILGYAMASFEEAGLPSAALPHLLDALESGRDPSVVAAAARGLRGSEVPNPKLADYLLRAVENIRYHDDCVCLEELFPEWPVTHSTTAVAELAKSFSWLGSHARPAVPELRRFSTETTDFPPVTRNAFQEAIRTIEADVSSRPSDCCEMPGARQDGIGNVERRSTELQHIRHLELENEQGLKGTVGKSLLGKPTVIGFFYTRCMNPHKCSFTIAKLGQLQQMLQAEELSEQINIAVVTYDPDHDTPQRIDAFCANRGLVLGENASGYRVRRDQFETFREFFELGVNYASSVVNQHRNELFLIDHRGRVEASYLRLQWDVESVFEDLRSMARRAARPSALRGLQAHWNGMASIGLSILIALVPKCPICWAVYLSALGLAGLEVLPYAPWVLPLLVVAMAVNLRCLYLVAPTRNGRFPFHVSLVGALLLVPGYQWQMTALLYSGIATITAGAFLNSVPSRAFLRLQALWQSLCTTFQIAVRSKKTLGANFT